jgi:hypothetical protein
METMLITTSGVTVLSVLSEVMKLLRWIRPVSGSNLGRNNSYSEIFVVFLRLSRHMLG